MDQKIENFLGTGGRSRVYRLLKDGKWHSKDQILKAAGRKGKPATEGLRRLRELRKQFTITCRRKAGKLYDFEYRLRS